MSYSGEKSKVLSDWMKANPNIVKNYEVVDTEIPKKTGRFEHRIELTNDYHINDRKVLQEGSAENLIWSLNYCLEEE